MTPERWAGMDDDARFEAVDEAMKRARNGAMVPYCGFNGGGPASNKSKAYVRSLLTRHAGKADAEVMRWYLNELRRDDRVIDMATVASVLMVLKAI